MNAQVRNTSEFSSYLDIQNAKDIFQKIVSNTGIWVFTSRENSKISATVLEQGKDRRGMAEILIKSFLEIWRWRQYTLHSRSNQYQTKCFRRRL